MSDILFSAKDGLYFDIDIPRLGHQDKGLSPRGAQDYINFLSAFNMLDKPNNFSAIEMIYPSLITAEQDILAVICGADYENTYINDTTTEYNKVIRLNKGQQLKLSGAKNGFRTIFIAIRYSEQNKHLLNNYLDEKTKQYILTNYRNKTIRAVKGPEFDVLLDDALTNNTWKISPNSSQMGVFLEGKSLNMKKVQMISQPVNDGTIQLSPSGPIILMRHRQTVGGYPRIANVIKPDISKLAQFSPNSNIRIEIIDFEEARAEIKKLDEILL